MPKITQVGRVLVPASDQDAAIAFYRDVLGFSLLVDVPFGEGDGVSLALAPPWGEFQPGSMTGIALE